MIARLTIAIYLSFFALTSVAFAKADMTIDPELGFPKVFYHDIWQVQRMLKNFAIKNPDIAQYIEYGTSPDKLPFMALKISDNVTVDENEPELMFTAGTHGDETITTEVLLGLIGRLHSSYGKDPRLTLMVDEHEIFFIPVVNPDGFVKWFRTDHMEDPNRSYPYPGKTNNVQPTPSIAAIIQFFHQHDIKGSIDYHAAGEVILYPWAYTIEPMDQETSEQFYGLAALMASTNSYAFGPIAEIMYLSAGSSADYYFWKNKTLAFGVEMGVSKEPQIDLIEKYTDKQMEALWLFIEQF